MTREQLVALIEKRLRAVIKDEESARHLTSMLPLIQASSHPVFQWFGLILACAEINDADCLTLLGAMHDPDQPARDQAAYEINRRMATLSGLDLSNADVKSDVTRMARVTSALPGPVLSTFGEFLLSSKTYDDDYFGRFLTMGDAHVGCDS